jgi:hypothetical protein
MMPLKLLANIKKQKPLQGCFIQKKNERYNAPILGKFPIGQNAPKKIFGEFSMKNTYCKCMLYAYPHVDKLLEQLDTLAEKKALASMDDYSPCIEQCESILAITAQKDVLIELKIKTDKILSGFTSREKDLLDYKYFKQKPKEYYKDFDFTSRGYFRRQQKLIKQFSERLEKIGATDEWFEKNCLTMDFFKELLKRVYEHEKNSMKNKPKAKTAKKQQGQAYDKKGVKLSA